MSSKRKLEASDLLPSLLPPRLVEEDEDTATLHVSDFLPFFSMLVDDDNDDDDNNDEEEEEDRHSAVTLSSAVGRMHIDITDEDDGIAEFEMHPLVKQEEEVKVKLEPGVLPTIRPRNDSSFMPNVVSSMPKAISSFIPKAAFIKKEQKQQQQYHVNEAGNEHPVYYSAAEITDITRRLSDLYSVLRHVRCQVQIHSLDDADVLIQGPDELEKPRIPVLQLSFIERELCVAFSSTPTHIDNDDDDNVFSDVKTAPRRYSPCARGDQCVGLTDQWASLYSSADDPSTPFRGAILPALFFPEELDSDNGHVAKSRHRPCFFCLIKQIHEMWLMFAVNRLSMYTLNVAPLQCFSNVHGDGEFNRSVLLKPGTHAFNGLVEPILMYVHNKLLWDFDPTKKQWRVNIDALKHPKSAVAKEPGVIMGPPNPNTKISSKKPLNSSGEASASTTSS